MNLDLGQAFDRAQTVVNGLVAAIPSVVVALVVFGAFLVVAAIVKGVVARLTEARLRAHRNAGVPVGRLAQGLVILLGLLVALSVALPTFRPGTSADPWHRERRHRVCVPDILQNFLAGILLLITSRFASAIRLWPALRRHGRGHSDPRDVHPHLRWPTRRGPQRRVVHGCGRGEYGLRASPARVRRGHRLRRRHRPRSRSHSRGGTGQRRSPRGARA